VIGIIGLAFIRAVVFHEFAFQPLFPGPLLCPSGVGIFPLS
jgi:hypothetical protein